MAALRATGRQVYAINPMAVARYRERWTLARSKSDHADALVLANILRTDRARLINLKVADFPAEGRDFGLNDQGPGPRFRWTEPWTGRGGGI